MKNEVELITLSTGEKGVRSALEISVRERLDDSPPSTSSSQHVLDFISSSATLDRYHEIIEPGGWRLENYRRNPVFQNSHNYGDVLFTLGKALVTEVRGEGGQKFLFQRIAFATEANPVSRIAYNLYKGGFLHAVSVGFIPVRWENGSGESEFRRRYLEQELLEVSAVSIPANPDALQLAVKAGAVATVDVKEAQELLECLTRADGENKAPGLRFLEQLRRVMKCSPHGQA